MVDEMTLFPGENAETVVGEAIIHTSADKEELRDKSKKVASCEEVKREDFGGSSH